MKGVGIVENLELLYSLKADDGESVKDLETTIGKLQKILKDNNDLKLNITGFDSLSSDLKKVTDEAKNLKMVLSEIKNFKIDIFGSAKGHTAKQSQALKQAANESKKAQEQLKKMNDEIDKANKKMRELNVYKTKTFNSLDNAYSKGNIGIKEYIKLSKITRAYRDWETDRKSVV